MKLVKKLKSLDEYVTARQDNRVCYKGELYFWKTGDLLLLLNELVAEELAQDFKIPCAHYEIGTLCDKPVVISKSVFKNDVKVYSLLNLVGYEMDLETLWNEIDQRYNDYNITSKLMKEIVNVFLFDVLIANDDRHGLNLYIEEKENDVHVAPIFDNENMLSEISIFHQMYIIKPEFDHEGSSNKNILEYFLKISDSEYAKKLYENLWIIEEKNLNFILDKIEKEREITINSKYKKYIILKFKQNLEMIKKALSKIKTENHEKHRGLSK